MENGLNISSSTAFMNDIAEVWRYSMNLCTGEVVENNLTPECWTDFPVVPKQHVGQPTRYCYSPQSDPEQEAYASLPALSCLVPNPAFLAFCKIHHCFSRRTTAADYQLMCCTGYHISSRLTYLRRKAKGSQGRSTSDQTWPVGNLNSLLGTLSP